MKRADPCAPATDATLLSRQRLNSPDLDETTNEFVRLDVERIREGIAQAEQDAATLLNPTRVRTRLQPARDFIVRMDNANANRVVFSSRSSGNGGGDDESSSSSSNHHSADESHEK